MEHVYEKIINLDNESQTTSSSNNEKAGEQEKDEDIAVLAEEKIELLCQDQVNSLSAYTTAGSLKQVQAVVREGAVSEGGVSLKAEAHFL